MSKSRIQIRTPLAVSITTVYGRERIYPENEIAHQFAALIGTKCFSRDHLIHIRRLGYEINIAPTKLNLGEK